MVSNDAPAAPSDGVMARATALASQPCPLARPAPALWAMLTAVSPNARERRQGMHILLQNADHVLGRSVKEASCQFDSPNVSHRHCTISRRYLNPENQTMPPNHIPNAATDRLVVTIRDSSSNGTFVNFQRLQRNGEEMQLHHGDVVSLVGTPENATSFSFVYREISDHVRGAAAAAASLPPCEPAGPSTKRKTSPPDDAGEVVGGDGKRIKGIGNGNVSGPILLNDVRQLQRSNEELRVLVEAHVREVEKMRSEHRSAEARHATELKEAKAAVAEKFKAEQEELKRSLAIKEAEAEASTASRLQLESSSELLQQRLASEAKSRVDAEEVIDGLKSIVGELEKLLEEERAKISKERAEAETSLRAALDRIRVEAAEELKRHEETALRQQEQQNEIILALQEGEKEYRAAAEISRKKLDSERAAVVAAEERARRLESQFQEEKVLSLSAQNRADDIEVKLWQTCKELEDEKVVREGAQVNISRLEVEMEAASRDLQLEKQRLQGARERIVLRETQMRAFHSTAAEIADLQQRQQGQLLTMIRALEDGDSDNDADDHTTTTSNVRSTAAPFQGSKRVQETRKASQSTAGSQPLRVVAKRADDKNKGPVMDDDGDDDTEGNTQRDDGCSNASHSSTTRSSDVNIPPTQAVDFQIASTYDEAGFHVQSVHGKLEFVQFASCGGDTLLEHGDAGSTQLANEDAGCTQLLTHDANLEGAAASARVICEGVSAHQARSVGREEVPPARTDGAAPMDEDTEALPDVAGRAGYLLDSTAQCDDGGADEDRGMMSLGASQADAAAFKDRHHQYQHQHQHQQRDSLCTADLLASEVAGSWAMATPASALGEDDSSSAERVEAPVMRRLRVALDESAAHYPPSQVATNTVAGEKHPPDGPTDAKAAAHDVDMDMSQTKPKLSHHHVAGVANVAGVIGVTGVRGVADEALRLQEQQQRVTGGDGVLDLARDRRVVGVGGAGGLGDAGGAGGARRDDNDDDDNSSDVRDEALRFQQQQQQRVPGEIVLKLVRGRRIGGVGGVGGMRRDDDDDDSSDTSSTEEGSREEGEIGASELRDSEPASSSMMFAH